MSSLSPASCWGPLLIAGIRFVYKRHKSLPSHLNEPSPSRGRPRLRRPCAFESSAQTTCTRSSPLPRRTNVEDVMRKNMPVSCLCVLFGVWCLHSKQPSSSSSSSCSSFRDDVWSVFFHAVTWPLPPLLEQLRHAYTSHTSSPPRPTRRALVGAASASTCPLQQPTQRPRLLLSFLLCISRHQPPQQQQQPHSQPSLTISINRNG